MAVLTPERVESTPADPPRPPRRRAPRPRRQGTPPLPRDRRLAAALTAWRFVQGRATPVGDDRDGFIWLPVTEHDLLPSYGRLTEREALAAARRLAG